MSGLIKGLHHITLCASGAQEDVDFCTKVMGQRLIKQTVLAAQKHNVWVSVCGEMAGDPTLTPLLIGLGVDELSAAPAVLPQLKYLIRRLKLADTQELAAFALECESATEILARSTALAQRVAPSLFEMRK